MSSAVTQTANPSGADPKWSRQRAWLLSAAAVAIVLACLRMAMTTPYKLTTFHQLVHFEAVEPFQRRVLLPAIVAGVQQIVPLGTRFLFGVVDAIAWFALILVACRALVFFDIARRDRTRWLLAFTIIIPVVLHLLLPNFTLALAGPDNDGFFAAGALQPRPLFYYVYDLPAAVFTLAMTLLLARQTQRAAPRMRHFLPYLAVFALATVNRETSLLMLAVFALMFRRRLTWRRWMLLLAIQAVIFVAVQWPLNWLFADNVNPSARLAGTQYEFHLLENLGLFANPVYLLAFSLRFAAGLYLPMLLWWRHLDQRLATALIGLGLPLICLAMLAGRVQEYRVFIEVVPLIWIGAVQTIAARRASAQAEKSYGAPPTCAA